ncbi:hypothetical protein KIN20_032789 [Parelaphostrongylus tenuis]|uniref:Delta-like protein n=1 Tax=Parelaphostrongylus tenuis TaxID=148309 RepID=A0AAD5R7G4_PARTN|nr:hypothetical protein KIN20_032789 [Parelaphostrongylus tenuis]
MMLCAVVLLLLVVVFSVVTPGLKDYIAVIINVTSNGGNHYGIRERLLVDGSLPNRSITMRAGLLKIDFAIICEIDYFGLRCARYCKPSAANYRHVGCTSTGEAICIQGWTGENCSTVLDDRQKNRVSSQLARVRVTRNALEHPGMHTFVFGALMFSALFVGYVLCAPSPQVPGDFPAVHRRLLTQSMSS